MPNRRALAAACFIAYLATIVIANYAVTHHDPIHVGFGYVVAAGTVFAGAAFVLRDALDDTTGRQRIPWVIFVAIGLGCALSYHYGSGDVAVASAAAFGVSELLDLAIYRPLRDRGYIRAAVASNAAGALVDSWIFIGLANLPFVPLTVGNVTAQTLVKFAVTIPVVLAVAAYRRRTSSRRRTSPATEPA